MRRTLVTRLLRALLLTATLLFAATAFAATAAPAASVVIALTPTTVVIALLSVLAGYVAQAVSTGSVFGIAVVPQTWLPYLTLFGSFLTAFVQSIVAAPVQDATGWFNALLAGLLALTGLGAGVVAHVHTVQPKLTRLRLAEAARAVAKAAGVVLLLGGLGSLVTTQTGCQGSPFWTSIVKTVLADLENGVALSDIEQAVEVLDPAIAGDVAAADSIIQAAINFLQLVGAIPPATQSAALAMQQKLGEKIAAAKKSGWVLSPEAGKLVAEFAGGHPSPRAASIARAVRASL
jgi:hypothetical protein